MTTPSSDKKCFISKLFFMSSVGRKYFSAITGLFLVGFLFIHLMGNLTLFLGSDVFNFYAHQLEKNKVLLFIMEAILFLGFLSHIVMGFYLTLQNRKARPQSYKKRRTLGMSTFFSNNMALGGSLIFIFLIIHVKHFRFGEMSHVENLYTDANVKVKDLHTLVVGSFKDGAIYSIFYIIAMFFVGGHVAHGFQSAFRSLGLSNKRLYAPLKKISCIIGFLVALCFAAMPFYFAFCQ